MIDKDLARELLKAAEDARGASWCPYSSVSVGAALLTKSGKVYTGANIESASYSPTVCAERVAIFRAVHEGEREFSAIAIVGGEASKAPTEPTYPCGVCRQVMAEFASPDMTVIVSDGKTEIITTLGELLPNSFHLPR